MLDLWDEGQEADLEAAPVKVPFVFQYCKEIDNIHVCTFRLETNDVSLRPFACACTARSTRA